MLLRLTLALGLTVPSLLSAQALASVTARADTAVINAPKAAPVYAPATATRITRPPVLDGRTDDPIWADARMIDQFLEYEPNEGAVPRFKTEVRITYDDKFLYILARMHDPAPDSIVSLLSRRDVRTNSEQLKIVIDSYHDRRTAYQFAVNPAGVKRDYYVYNDAEEDDSWDAIWDVATTIDSLGWVAEMRIPFSQLRFANKPDHTFGLLIVRDIARTRQRISWPLYYRNRQGYISQGGELNGIQAIPRPRRLEVTPYAVSKAETKAKDNDEPGYDMRPAASAGADIKYGISSNLTLDATINPDFGQVEADPAVLNLSAFETFLQERRPFFLEGTGIFQFNVQCGDIDSGCTGLFYSRRIGRGPQLSGFYYDPRNTNVSTILGAAKVTGRLGNGMSVGILNALTQREANPKDATIEPRTNYFVARLQQDLKDGNSGVGAMLTAVNRDADEFTIDILRRQAYAGGVDLRHRFLDKKYELRAYVSGSVVRGSEDAIARTQQGGVHNYQRPDDNVDFDPTRTTLLGDAERLSVSKFGGGITRFQSVFQRFSPGYEINDLGYLSRADEIMFRNWFALQFNKPNAMYNRASFNFNSFNNWTAAGMPLNFGVNQNSHIEFKNTWWGHLGFNYNNFAGKYFDDRAARGGPAVRKSADASFWGGIDFDQRWQFIPGIWGGGWTGYDWRSKDGWIEPNLSVRAATNFSASLGLNISAGLYDKQPWQRGPVSDADGVHYTFTKLRQTSTGITARANYTATPNLTLQLYVNPFVSTGVHTDWVETSDDPRADDYDSRYQPFAGDHDGNPATAVTRNPGGIRYRSVNSNAVVRWEYRPGSTLFFVWTHGREDYREDPTYFNFNREYRDLLSLHPNNTFLIKASYWFSP
jgi:hypothetical protein